MRNLDDDFQFQLVFHMLSMCALSGLAAALLFYNLWWLGIPLGVYLTLQSLYWSQKNGED